MTALGFFKTYLWLLIPMMLRYLFLASSVHTLLWHRKRPVFFAERLASALPRRTHLLRELRTSLAASLIYAFPAAVMTYAYFNGGTKLYWGWPETIGGWFWLPISIGVFMLIHDAYFYWMHRMMHLPRFYGAMHKTHHASKQPTSFASFAFSPWEAALASWLVPALTFVIPFHLGAFALFLMIATVSAVLNHAGWEVYPQKFLQGPIGRWVISARHHNLHHTKFQRNYGLYFRFWDVMMGTDDMSGDPVSAPATRPARAAKTEGAAEAA